MTQQKEKRLAGQFVNMYSIAEDGNGRHLQIHRFPWPPGSEKFQPLLERGFSFSRTEIESRLAVAENKEDNTLVETDAGSLICDVCGFEAKSEFGLNSHMRAHK